VSRPPYRDGRIHVLSERCSTCVFRAGNLMHLRSGRLADLVRTNLAADTAFSCHETLHEDGVDQALCRGYVDAYGEQVTPLRMAAALDRFTEVDPPS
jgi:hypothetical protein